MAWSLFDTADTSGVTPRSWADSVLGAIGAPKTAANEQSLIAWALNEGGGGQYNPLNTTLAAGGSTSFNSVGVQNYSSWGQGVEATANTLQSSDYTSIVQALKSGQGLGSGDYPGLSTWSGGGYDNVGGTWDSAAQYMGKGGTTITASSGGSSGGSGGGQQATLTSFLSSGSGGVLQSAGSLIHGGAVVIDRAFALFAPGQGWRIVFGLLTIVFGLGSFLTFTGRVG